MDAEKYLKTFERICDSFVDCEKCPCHKVVCMVDGKVDAKKAVEIVEKWDKEHPAKTRLTEFMRMFPKFKEASNSKYPVICAKHVDERVFCEGNCDKCKENFWDEEVE